jgi:hypothetical protein
MASAIRFQEVINNNGTALTGNTLRVTAISSDDFKWAYAGSGTNRYVEFYDRSIGAERVATITTGSYAALTSASGTIASVNSSVSGVGKQDAPVSGVSTATGTFIINAENIAVAYLTDAGSSNVEYIFNGKKYDFAVAATPTNLHGAIATYNALTILVTPFALRFINNNRVLTAATGAAGCTFSSKFIKTASVIASDTAYSAVANTVSEIYLDTPDNLVLASTTALTTIVPGF